MSTVIIKFQFGDGMPVRTFEVTDLVKRSYGGAVTFLSSDTLLIETFDTAQEVFGLLSHLFTYDDKLFVGTLEDFCSLHQLPKVNPSMHKIAI